MGGDPRERLEDLFENTRYREAIKQEIKALEEDIHEISEEEMEEIPPYKSPSFVPSSTRASRKKRKSQRQNVRAARNRNKK